jgi:Pilus assembly protein, PilP
MKLGPNYKLPKFVTKLVIALCIVAFMGVASVSTARESGKADLNNRKDRLDEVFKLTGIEQIAHSMGSQLFGDRQGPSQFPPGQVTILKNMMSRVYEPDEWLRSIQRRMMKNYQPQHITALRKWYQSPLGEKIVKVETQESIEGMTGDKKAFFDELKYYPPKENRLELAERLETAVGMTDYKMDTLVMFVKVLFPFNEQWKGQSIRSVSLNVRDDHFDSAREYFLQSFLYKFRNLSDKELSQYVTFATSPAGKWFYRSYFRGSKDALEKTSVESLRLLDQIQKEMADEGGKSALLKEIAPPGQRYVFVRKRDPFTPLVDPKEGLIQPDENDESEMEFRKFADELKSLPQIPMEVYRNLKKSDPRLYADLEHFGGLFSQETKMASLGEDDYLDTVHKYKDLIQKANDTQPSMIITPIQADYEKLQLVGVIWKNNETIALVETGDNKGHSVKEGDLLGPNFGVVETIDNNQLMILEQSRDYLGNILSKKKQLEIINEAAEEG